ncbi:Protein of unknown function [Gryllus bimaculatus]|nr:Protein of unknown function [Gryllus bimaculatus]
MSQVGYSTGKCANVKPIQEKEDNGTDVVNINTYKLSSTSLFDKLRGLRAWEVKSSINEHKEA